MRYSTYLDGMFHSAGTFHPDTDNRENELIVIEPDCTDQVWEGFGGAVTDSAGYVYSLLSPEQQAELLNAYFSPGGLNYGMVRVPIDSCDFSLEPYEAAPDGGQLDMSRPLRYILPLLEDIRAIRGDLTLMLSPWSPPAVFKTNGLRQGGGACRPEYYPAWAEYLCRYVQEFEARGFPVRRMSIQNEPHAVQIWDSCIWSAEAERVFLTEHLKPALLRYGLENVEVYIWDHNKERILERSRVVLQGAARDAADGVAFHWYSGDHFAALRQVHALYPEKKLLLSENCIELLKYDRTDDKLFRSMLAHEILGDLESGTNAFFDWNLVLDSRGGPNYVGNYCLAPFLYDGQGGKLERQSIYDAVWHFAHFIPAGSLRILSSSFTSEIETTAFHRPDDSLSLVLLNRGGARRVYLRMGGEITSLELPERALMTVLTEEAT